MIDTNVQRESGTSRRGAPEALGSDERGAIMVMGLFFAVFTLGALWYMMGLADTIHYRERMQDAADAGALAGAILHARGMNTIVLINWLMAAVLAVMVALRLIEGLIIVAEFAVIVASIFGGGAASLIPVLENQRQNVKNLSDRVEPIINNVLYALHQIGVVVRSIVPVGANLRVIGVVAQGYQPEVTDIGGFAIPPRITLPVEDDDYSVLCGKAGELVGDLAMLPLRPILPDFVTSAVSDALGALASAGSGWFCGEQGARPPSYKPPDRDEARPVLDEVRQCGEAGSRQGASEDEVLALCRAAEQMEYASMPDPNTGACREGQSACVPIRQDDGSVFDFPEGSWCASDGAGVSITQEQCSIDSDSPYGKRLLAARAQCAPERGQTKLGYFYTVRHVRVVERRTSGQSNTWIEEDRSEHEQTHNNSDDDSRHYRDVPCEARPGDPWNATNLEEPVCRTPPDIQYDGPLRRTTTWTEVTQIYSCRQRVPGRAIQVNSLDMSASNTSTGEYSGDSSLGNLGNNSDSSQSNKNPFRFQEGLLLGTSDLQIRSLVLGRDPRGVGAAGNADGAVRLTRWNRRSGTTSDNFLNVARLWGRFSVAQAEYYYEGSEERSEWMWNMKWTARLRRFRLNNDGDDGGSGADGSSRGGDPDTGQWGGSDFTIPGTDQLTPGQLNCNGNSDCDTAGSNMNLFNDLFLH